MKAMNLSTGIGSIGVYRWNSSTQGELVTSSDHVHFQNVRQSVAQIFVSVAASHSSLYIIWEIELLAQNICFSKHTISREFFSPICFKQLPKPPRSTYKQSPPANTLPFFSRVKDGRGVEFLKSTKYDTVFC